MTVVDREAVFLNDQGWEDQVFVHKANKVGTWSLWIVPRFEGDSGCSFTVDPKEPVDMDNLRVG